MIPHLLLPVRSYFNNPMDLDCSLRPTERFSSPTQATRILDASKRMLEAIDPALVSKDRAHGSGNCLYRLVCAIYYVTRKFFVRSSFLNTVIDLHTRSNAFLIEHPWPQNLEAVTTVHFVYPNPFEGAAFARAAAPAPACAIAAAPAPAFVIGAAPVAVPRLLRASDLFLTLAASTRHRDHSAPHQKPPVVSRLFKPSHR